MVGVTPPWALFEGFPEANPDFRYSLHELSTTTDRAQRPF